LLARHSHAARHGRERHGVVQQIHVSQAKHLETLGHCSVVGCCQEELKNSSEERIIDFAAADESVLSAHSAGERDKVLGYPSFNGLDKAVGNETVE
jgi:hypothetical protein